MNNERLFLNWSQPALPAFVEELIKRYRDGREVDLSNVIVVFPGRQAGRRFLEILTDKSAGEAIPPRIITVGTLPEFLYLPKFPFASPLTQKLAWAEALKGLQRDQLEVVIPQPPEDYDVDAWLRLGELLRRQHRELAADGLSFSDVAERGQSLESFNETDRWNVLAEVQKRYLQQLDEAGLWDQQTARLFAIDRNECQTDAEIFLVGTVDLNHTLQSMLKQVAEHVHVVIHAPPEESSRFAPLGNLQPGEWNDFTIEIEETQIQVVDGPQEQAEQVALELEACGANFSIDEITIGVPDDRIVPHIERFLAMSGVSTNWVIEQTLPQSGPYRLLQCVASYLEADRTDHFSELIRHPDLSSWISQQDFPVNWLTCWDENVTEHLQRRTQVILGSGRSAKTARELVRVIGELLKPFQESSRPLADWVGPLRKFLLQVYGGRDLNPDVQEDRLLLQATQKIHEAALEHGRVPAALEQVVTAQQAIELTLDELRSEFLAAPVDEHAVQLSGWLDLPLDDAPVAILTSMNEGFIPSAVNHDLFLPNRLRTHLGIEDNQRRYARDAYAISVLLHSRKRVKLIAAKRDARKEPLTPSRLLFAASPEKVAHRIVRFFDDREEDLPAIKTGFSTQREDHDFRIPKPVKMDEPKRSFRVTEFKDYLVSPYRYYLRHVLKLGEVSDSVVELDPAGFGSLIHDVLQEFGQSDETLQTDPVQVSRFLNSQLDQLVHKRYGSDPLFPVHIQVEQIRHRLKIFAQWQADWVRQGWEMKYTEIGFGKNATLNLTDGSPITLRGRIDRVDYHPKLNEWVIFDYKTSDKAQSPEQTHRHKDEWVDLQLPLYRHLAKPFGVQGKVRLGYITLPRTTPQIRDQIAEWGEDELKEADDVARKIAENIINEEFWVELDKPITWFQEFSGICQDDVFGREAVV
ncbi:PD-(D/E)XK nuclease family protein [Thalassoglobus sp.]|uniref:PD-(D/E)XK nuclease family protein n=1 Tax=Thalassoglobus sp. TaxID=2795869 RepID=UPI003AA9DCC2